MKPGEESRGKERNFSAWAQFPMVFSYILTPICRKILQRLIAGTRKLMGVEFLPCDLINIYPNKVEIEKKRLLMVRFFVCVCLFCFVCV